MHAFCYIAENTFYSCRCKLEVEVQGDTPLIDLTIVGSVPVCVLMIDLQVLCTCIELELMQAGTLLYIAVTTVGSVPVFLVTNALML